MLKRFSFYFFLLFMLFTGACGDQESTIRQRRFALSPADDFVITIKSDNPGDSADDQFTVYGRPDIYNYDIDCNDDGIWEGRHLTDTYTCDYSTLGGPGTYTLRIRGLYPGFAAPGNPEKIMSVEQWGSNRWEIFNFRDAIHLKVNAQDTPRFQNGATLYNAFRNTNLSPSIGNWNWDTSKVVEMWSTFRESNFNEDISSWDTSNVTSFNYIFEDATAFNQDIGHWNTGSATSFGAMFDGATAFDRNLSQWNVENSVFFFRFTKDHHLSTPNYDALLIGWSANPVNSPPRARDFHMGTSTYCTGGAGRDAFIAAGWTVIDGGRRCDVNVEIGADISEIETSSAQVPQLLILGTLETSETISIVDTGQGSATIGLDYQFASPLVITIPPGTYDGTSATAIDITGLTIIDDSLVESDENIVLEIVQPSTMINFTDANNDGNTHTRFTYTIVNQDTCSVHDDCLGNKVCNLTKTPTLCQDADMCGNSVIESGEACDDGNSDPQDGCNDLCFVELGFTCVDDGECASALCDTSTMPSLCELPDTCGNGRLELNEICDDGNLILSDGCDGDCKLEDGIECEKSSDCASGICDGTSQPAKCEASGVCGNAIQEPGEGCDDGNNEAGDGCDENCKLEDENNCVGDRNCKEGFVCGAEKRCILECESDGDCGGKTCDRGRCLMCDRDADCADNFVCDQDRQQCKASCLMDNDCFPSGFCDSERSHCVECRDSLDCLDDETCNGGACENAVCNLNDSCQSSCQNTQDCASIVGRSFCDTAAMNCVECLESSDCKDGEVCQDHQCQPGCGQDSDCAEGHCNDDGLCVDCLETQDCPSGICENAQCVDECQKSEDCKDGYYCALNEGRCKKGCDEDESCDEGSCRLEDHVCVLPAKPEKEPEAIPRDVVESGCGCATRSTGSPFWFFLFGIFLWRRR